jgi:catechol 2,3-dioxygenase-like lactoylglutathione lyase family enzyme
MEYRGINHVALVCRDMKETVEFYQGVLEMPLVKTLDLPDGRGQHFFFDCGGGSTIAFFWFPDAPAAAPGIASMDRRPGASMVTAHASMNHLAISVPLEKFDGYAQRLKAKGVRLHVLNHNDGPEHASTDVRDTTWIRSMYFADPNGLWMELAAFTRPFNAADVAHEPARHEDRERYLRGRQATPTSVETVG